HRGGGTVHGSNRFAHLRRSPTLAPGPDVPWDEVAMYVTVRGTRPPRTGSSATGRRAVSATVVLLGLTSLFTDISSEMVVAVLPLFATSQLALSPLAFGIIDGIYQGVSTLVRVGGGLTADLTGRPKAVAVAGYGLSAGAKLALLPVSSGVALGAIVATDR